MEFGGHPGEGTLPEPGAKITCMAWDHPPACGQAAGPAAGPVHFKVSQALCPSGPVPGSLPCCTKCCLASDWGQCHRADTAWVTLSWGQVREGPGAG